jgi:predicted DsbA family dithiol-disulfide isomerase/uncharacterized membrane protein
MLPLLLLRLPALVALAASAALFMHYIDPVDASFCAAESGCEQVRRSPISYFGSPVLNLPLLGLVAYGTVLFTSLAPERRRLAAWLAVAGGVGGPTFLLLQVVYVGAFCWLCGVVDAAAIAAALGGVLLLRRGAGPEPLRPGAWLAFAAIAALAPPLWSRVRPAEPVPGVVRALYVPGKINVVEFADFECPFCRRLHPILKQAISEYPEGRVHLVRMNVPLDHHPNAHALASAHVCARAQGQGDRVADLLNDREPGPEAIRAAQQEAGLDTTAFHACLEAPETRATLERETAVLREAGMLGLPTTYIGGKRFVGAVSIEAIREALDLADRGETERGIPAPLYLGLILAAVAATLWRGRARSGGDPA